MHGFVAYTENTFVCGWMIKITTFFDIRIYSNMYTK